MEYQVKMGENELYERVARWMAKWGVDMFEVRPEGDFVKVFVDGKVVAKVEKKRFKRGKGISTVYYVSDLIDEKGGSFEKLIRNVKPRKAEPFEILALLATDGTYNAKTKMINAATTSVLQAMLYRSFGMEVRYAKRGTLTRKGLKPIFFAWLSKEEGGGKIVKMLTRYFQVDTAILRDDAKLRAELLRKTLDLLDKVPIDVIGDATNQAEVKTELKKRVVKFLRELRLGGVCLTNCNPGELTLTINHEPYSRVIIPLVHYIVSDNQEEAEKFLAYVILFDGTVRPENVRIFLGRFRSRSKYLPLDMYDKLVLYLILIAKHEVALKSIYIGDDEILLSFANDYAAKIFKLVWNNLVELLKWGNEVNLDEDHLYKKLKRMKLFIRRLLNEVEIIIKFNFSKVKFSDSITIINEMRSPKDFDQAVEALKRAGFEEDLHFTAKRPKDDERGFIRLRTPAGLWRLVELERQGVDWAKKALDQLEEFAKVEGFYETLVKKLKPAREAETLDPKGMAVEDNRGMKIVIKDLELKWVNSRPRIIVRYNVNDDDNYFYFTWGTEKDGGVRAAINVGDVAKALVLATLVGDESIKEKRGIVKLSARDLFKLARFKGVGWDLLRWYARVMI